jgi:predicted DNA-binding transcriptional regulator AlpA
MAISISPSTVPTAGTTPARRFLDVKEVGHRLTCSWRTLLRLMDRGTLPQEVKIGALRCWDADELEQWIAGGCMSVRALRGP